MLSSSDVFIDLIAIHSVAVLKFTAITTDMTFVKDAVRMLSCSEKINDIVYFLGAFLQRSKKGGVTPRFSQSWITIPFVSS